MAPTQYSADVIQAFLQDERIASLEQLKQALGTIGTMTVFRKLKALGYLSSYSHRGKYYTLQEIPEFDAQGLWGWHSVWFSRYGNLVETAREFVEEAASGFTASELEGVLHVECKRALLKLHRDDRLARARIAGVNVYLANHKDSQRRQRLCRQEQAAMAEVVPPVVEALSHEGDRKIADLLGLDVHTVARGRRELFGGDVDPQRVRRQGGGRKAVEKKRRTSSRSSGS